MKKSYIIILMLLVFSSFAFAGQGDLFSFYFGNGRTYYLNATSGLMVGLNLSCSNIVGASYNVCAGDGGGAGSSGNVTAVSFAGTSTKTLTVTNSDSTQVTGQFTDLTNTTSDMQTACTIYNDTLKIPNLNDYWNMSKGTLGYKNLTLCSEGQLIKVSSGVWTCSADATAGAGGGNVTAVAFTGTSTKTLTVTNSDGTLVIGTFTDLTNTTSDIANICFNGTLANANTVNTNIGNNYTYLNNRINAVNTSTNIASLFSNDFHNIGGTDRVNTTAEMQLAVNYSALLKNNSITTDGNLTWSPQLRKLSLIGTSLINFLDPIIRGWINSNATATLSTANANRASNDTYFNQTIINDLNSRNYITDGNTNWDNSYGLIANDTNARIPKLNVTVNLTIGNCNQWWNGTHLCTCSC